MNRSETGLGTNSAGALSPGAPANPALDPQSVFGLAALYGCAKSVTRKFDVLDLGCGAGHQLERYAAQGRGLLVGVDPDEGSCAAAREKLARHGGRAQILRGDFAGLDARSLGRFDLVLVRGFLDRAPAERRRPLLEMIGPCLTPGGVAAMVFHAATGFGASHIESVVAPRGVEYLNDLPPGAFGAHATSQERAYAADSSDAVAARERVAIFGKVGDASSAPNPRSPHLRWATRLVHPAVGLLYRAPATYHDAVLSRAAHIARVETQAALDEFSGAPKNFAQLLGGARARLAKAGVRPHPDISDIISEDMLKLTWSGLAAPLWKQA